MLEAMNPTLEHLPRPRGAPSFPHDEQRIYARNLEVPSGGGVGTARAIAHAYGVFATGGRELGLRRRRSTCSRRRRFRRRAASTTSA